MEVDRNLCALLEAEYGDRPAFGLTERVVAWDGVNPYGPAAQVEQVRLALDAAGSERAVLVGHSAGGAIALHTALEARA